MPEIDLFKGWMPSINSKTEYIFSNPSEEEEIERKYQAFIINRALSQHIETVFSANDMNIYGSSLDPKLQYDYHYYGIPKGKRYSKWASKGVKPDAINMLVEAYKISIRKAEEIVDLFSEEDLENLSQYLYKGGKNEWKNKKK